MQGNVGFETQLGEGSAFWIELPAAASISDLGALPDGLRPLAEDGSPQIKVLYIEDNASNLALVEHIVKSQPWLKLISSTRGEIGIELARLHRPDVILLDLMMPHIDGFAILESVRGELEESAFLPVLVLTADANEKTKLRALSLGATDFLHKPFDKTEVVLRIRNLLKGRLAHQLLDNHRAALEETI